MELEHKFTKVNGVNIHYVEALPKVRKTRTSTSIVFLHGFPEYWETWKHQLLYFQNDYRVIAPDLPGYNLSDKPQDLSFYKLPNLIKFVAELIKSLCPNEKVYLVAHDWGGAIAWPLTAFHPNLVERLIILNAAHPSTFTREMINNGEQRQKSDYIHELINKDAENLLSKNEFSYLSDKTMVGANDNVFSKDIKRLYKLAWQQEGAINGMLQYYRAMPQLAPSVKHQESSGPVVNTNNMTIPEIRINTPTLILWGELDQAFVIENLDGLDTYINDYTIRRFPDASHWLQHEKSPEINKAIEEFISLKNN